MSSYCRTSRIAVWNLGFVSDLYKGVTDITVVLNSTGDVCGFTAYYPVENQIMFVFRGTKGLDFKNWMSNLDFLSIDYPGCSGCKVHGGFYKAYLQIQQGMISSGKRLVEKYPNAKKIVTGHSLGGALAVHASLDIVKNFGPIDEFYTFGQPRVGNENFANYVNVLVPGNFHSRLTNNRDPVPHLPLINMGFFHIDREVHYENGSFKICGLGEDKTCANSHLDLNILDHLSYMGKNLIPYFITCNL